MQKTLNSTSELTLFLPVDEAWSALDQYERLYLESEFATDDLIRIVNMHAVVSKSVEWSDSFEPALNRECKMTGCPLSLTWTLHSNDD
jgi:solute carrier family 25 carnitine/acylcarnitine transporter 20/29